MTWPSILYTRAEQSLTSLSTDLTKLMEFKVCVTEEFWWTKKGHYSESVVLKILTYHKATMRSRTSLMSLTPVSSCVTEICRSASSAWACKALSPSMISTLGISSASNDRTQFSKWTSNQDSNESMTWLSTTRKYEKIFC